MKYINKFETSEDLNNAKPQLQELEHYLAYDAENDKVYLKSHSYLIYEAKPGPIREIGDKILITNRCDLIKTLKIDGVEQDLEGMGKIRTPHVFTGKTEGEKISEIVNLITGEESSKYLFLLTETEAYKQYKVEIEWFDGITECILAFNNCVDLKSIPSDLFNTCTEVTNFSVIFYGCVKLENIPSGLFDKCTKVTNFNETFSNCTSLTSIPSGLFDSCKVVTYFYRTFSSCTSLTSIPSGLFDKCTEVTSFNGIFSGCENLTTIPEKIFSENKKVTDFFKSFENCSALTVMPKDNDGKPIYNRSGEGKEYYERVTDCINCFCGCDSIDGAESIPAYWGCVPM